MPDLHNIKNIYFLGVGGIGMSALARYFKHAGKEVAGYDKTSSKLTEELEREGIHIHYSENISLIPSSFTKENTLIVLTPAVPAEHKEFIYFKEHNFTILKRAQVLGMICKSSKGIAVAGTHGKTTTSSMIAHLLKVGDLDPSAFLGGITQNYRTNLLLGDSDYTVIEADEYDRSFLTLFPFASVITSLDPDHLDIYGDADEMKRTYQQFVHQVVPGGFIIQKLGLDLEVPKASGSYTYSYDNKNSDYYASEVTIINGEYQFNLDTPDKTISNIKFGIPGLHNIENAVAASAIALKLGVPEEKLRKGLATFKGVERRFEYYIKQENLVMIDDYAHHPEELKAFINSAKHLYPNRKVTGIFQPHLYTRTRDFEKGFIESLSLLDNVVLLDIYPARELPIPGITSQMLLDKISASSKKLVSKTELPSYIKNLNPELVLIMGAGDIDRLIEPVKQALLQNG
jgi:UDP-N-acetylmuramate--alanine ligase